MNKTIFHGITPKTTADREFENTTTELLFNIMQKKYVRQLVVKFFCPDMTEDVIKNISKEDLITQDFSRQEYGHPDFVIRNNDCNIIIENKIRYSTKLTDHEKNDYINFLDGTRKYERLIFLIPDGYDESEINKIKSKYTDKANSLSIKFWSDFFGYVEDYELAKDNPIIKQSIEFLFDSIDRQYITDTKFTKDEACMLLSPKLIINTISLSSKIYKLALNWVEGKWDKDNKSFTPGNNCPLDNKFIGKFFNINNLSLSGFIGIHFYLNETDANYMLSISYAENNIKTENLPTTAKIIDTKECGIRVFFPLDTDENATAKLAMENNIDEQQKWFNDMADKAFEQSKRFLKD
ncbi:MAG: hypothetical protein MJZ50_05175 [Treponema sp.]|nr:hypothetical protein [Treponema sp.]